MLDSNLDTFSIKDKFSSVNNAIKLLRPQLPTCDELLPWLRQIDESNWYTNFGPLNELLCQELADYFEGAATLTTSSGTSALELLLEDLSLPYKSRILVPAFTFPATVTAIIRAGFEPILADVSVENWQLTADLAEKYRLSEKFDAVLPVATFGVPLDPESWSEFSERYQIPVVFDAAGAFGNQKIPTNIPVAFSLHATKSFSSAEGGLIVCHNKDMQTRLKKKSNFGFGGSTVIKQDGMLSNLKMSEYHAAVGLASLKKWSTNKNKRLTLLQTYLRRFETLSMKISTQQNLKGNCISTFVIKLNNASERQSIEKQLSKQDIEFKRWYIPLINNHPAFSGLRKCSDLSYCNELEQTTIGLPFHPGVTEKDVETICHAIECGTF